MGNGAPTLAEQAYDVVEEMIVTLALPPGAIFSEGELSERIGIGRTPLREALQRLAADRLVTTLPRRGMRVAGINLLDFLALLETRRVLDRLIAARAAKRATLVQREALHTCAVVMQQATADLHAFLRADRVGDELIEAAAHNPFATRAAAPLHAHCRRFWCQYRHEGDLTASVALHVALLEAVADGEPTAAECAADALLNYLVEFTREILELD